MPDWKPEIRARLAGLNLEAARELEIVEEISQHLDDRFGELRAGGASEEEARRSALEELSGGGLLERELQRVERPARREPVVLGESKGAMLEHICQDLRYGLRMLRKSPGFTAVAVLTLALGIGANTAIFTVINTLLLRSLPVKDPRELVLVTSLGRNGPGYTFSYPLYERLRDGSRSLSGLFATGGVFKRRMVASGLGGTETEFIRAEEVTGNFFSVLGVPPMLGRTFTVEDDQPGNPQPVAVISHNFWQRRFGGDPSVVGKTVDFEGVPLTIVGITPPSFFGFEVGASPDLWWPMQMIPQVQTGGWGQRLKNPGSNWLRIMGRLAAGANRKQAQAELDVLYQRDLDEVASTRQTKWTDEMRRTVRERRLELQPGGTGWTRLRQQFRQPLFILMTVVALVLMIACANIASLQLVRAASRQREFSVRSALGANRSRLLRQLLTEGLLLAALGGLLGLFLAQAGTRAILGFMRLQENPISFSVAPDSHVLLFTTAAALLSGLVFGLVPALRGRGFDLASALKGSAGSVAGNPAMQRLNQSFVIVQVALSLILLVGAGLFLRTQEKLKGLDAGFSRENVLLFDLDFTRNLDSARSAALYKEVSARLETLPGVRSVSFSTFFLLSGQGSWRERVMPEGYAPAPNEDVYCHGLKISPRFFETMGTPVLSGRDFGPLDEVPPDSQKTNRPRTALINETMARHYFGNASPLGRRFHFGDNLEPSYEIIGVVKDAKYESLREPAPSTFYLSFLQQPGNDAMTFTIRLTSKNGALAGSIRRVLAEVDPTVQMRDLRMMNEVVNGSIQRERVLAQLGGFFGLFALTLACLGLYGVLSLAVAQRTREFGVRVALGAQRGDVLSLVVGQGLKLALAGSVVGLMGALAATRFVSSLLYGVTATDPMTFAGVSLLLVAVALLASWLPARRATRVDPMVALRCE